MRLLWEVIVDLADFAWYWIQKIWSVREPAQSLIAPPQKTALRQRQMVAIEELPESEDNKPNTFTSIKDVVERLEIPNAHTSKPAQPESVSTYQPTPMVVAVRTALLYKNPTREFDSVAREIPYGATVMVVAERGEWAEVTYGSQAGWVQRDELLSNQAQVRPYFIIKEYCGYEHESTERLRNIINDEFYGHASRLPLSPEEYVYYKLFVRGVVLPETDERPRQAGVWQKLFAGERGVHISVRPKTGSVMEYVTEEEEGRLGYVEAVFPDESISISEVGQPEVGFYNERTLGKEVWQHLKPVFITFT